jgi:hypothetical protein
VSDTVIGHGTGPRGKMRPFGAVRAVGRVEHALLSDIGRIGISVA